MLRGGELGKNELTNRECLCKASGKVRALIPLGGDEEAPGHELGKEIFIASSVC